MRLQVTQSFARSAFPKPKYSLSFFFVFYGHFSTKKKETKMKNKTPKNKTMRFLAPKKKTKFGRPLIPMAMANVRPIAAYTGGLKCQVCSLAYELAAT